MTRSKTAAGAVLALLAVLALAGCGLSNTGVAARVGDQVITVRQLGGLMDRSLANGEFRGQVGDNEAPYLRAKLGALIRLELLRAAARRLGVRVTPQQVRGRIDEFVADLGSLAKLEEQAARQGVAPRDLRAAVEELVLTDAVGAKLVEDAQVSEAELRKAYQDNIAQYDRTRPAHVLVTSRALADQVLRRARAGEDFAALARQHSTDQQTKANGGDLGMQGRGALDPAFEKVMRATPVGGIGGPVRTRFGWHVVKVLERKVTTFAQARAELRNRLLEPRAEEARDELLAEIAAATRIRVNPRFGRWDRQTASVLPPPDELASPSSGPVPPGGPRPGAPGAPGGPGGPRPGGSPAPTGSPGP